MVMAQAQAVMATAAQVQAALALVLAHTRSMAATTLHSGRRLPDSSPDDE